MHFRFLISLTQILEIFLTAFLHLVSNLLKWFQILSSLSNVFVILPRFVSYNIFIKQALYSFIQALKNIEQDQAEPQQTMTLF